MNYYLLQCRTGKIVLDNDMVDDFGSPYSRGDMFVVGTYFDQTSKQCATYVFNIRDVCDNQVWVELLICLCEVLWCTPLLWLCSHLHEVDGLTWVYLGLFLPLYYLILCILAWSYYFTHLLKRNLLWATWQSHDRWDSHDSILIGIENKK